MIRFPKRTLLLGVALWVLAGLWPQGAWGQKKTIAAGEGREKLVPEKNWQKETDEMKLFQSLRKGEQALSKTAEPVLDHAAQWYAYRLTNPDYHEHKAGKGMQEIRKEAQDQIINPRDPRKPPSQLQLTFKDEFDKRFAARLHEVVKNPKVIARVNAAILLAQLAATGDEETADILVEILQDPKETDAVKLYALRGVNALFALGRGDNSDPFRNKEREAKCVQALIDYLGRKRVFPPGAPQEQIAAVHFVRVEAIGALGETRLPAASRTVNKKVVLERLTALTLLRILGKEGLEPPPTLKEQVAAAVGLCQLRYRACDEYQVDYTAHHLGRFVVEFVLLYNNQGGEKKEAWKLLAKNLSKGLNELKADVEGPPSSDHKVYVARMVDQADRLLKDILDGKLQPDPSSFSTWLDQNPPKSSTVYKGMNNAVVKAGD